ncbi:MAG: AAA family ATPase, partial [Armatimonadota bacterium]
IKNRYEEFHHVDLTEDALSAAVDLSARYITERALPDKAIDLIDEAGSRVKLRSYREACERAAFEGDSQSDDFDADFCARVDVDADSAEMFYFPDSEQETLDLDDESDRPRPEVLRHDIAEIVSTWTGVPVTQLSQEESERLLEMEGALRQRVVGQDESITTVAKAVRRARAGVKDPRRPIGSFMFLGPTGVGKTLLARVLADYLFGDEDAMIRIDMSEYMERFAVSRLIGAPPGYVGYEEAGQLSEAVRRRPYSVVLFDEIEKAHPEVFSILLQIMEDGRLTDAQGRVVDFKNTVVIMTSNVGARTISETTRMGFATDAFEQTLEQERKDYTRMKSKVTEELKKAFSPEFLNRVDDVVVFHSLTKEQIRDIVQLEVGYLNERLKEQEIHLSVTEEVEDVLAEQGFDPAFGARPLRRQIRSLIEDPLAERILSCDAHEGCEILADLDDDRKITFRFIETAVTPHPA